MALVFIGEVGVVHLLRVADDDAARVEVIVEGLALAEELGGEEEVELLHAPARIAEVEATGVAHGDGRFDDHHGVGVDGQHEVDDFLDVGGVEVVLHRVVVGRGGDYDEVGVGIGRFAVEGGDEGATALAARPHRGPRRAGGCGRRGISRCSRPGWARRGG